MIGKTRGIGVAGLARTSRKDKVGGIIGINWFKYKGGGGGGRGRTEEQDGGRTSQRASHKSRVDR